MKPLLSACALLALASCETPANSFPPARIENGRIVIEMSEQDAAAAGSAVAKALANYQAATVREHERAVRRKNIMG